MASCLRNIRTKNYEDLLILLEVTVENVGDVFLGHSVCCWSVAHLQRRSSERSDLASHSATGLGR